MPVSMVVLACRPPEWTVEQFTTWWRGDHADMAKRLPGLIAYRHGAVYHDYDHADAPAWDGHAVLTFPSREDLDCALASPQWAEAVRHVGKMKGKRICLLTDELDLLATTEAAAGHDDRYAPGFVPDLFRLDGKVALITGGRGELAEVMACALADMGCDIALASRHQADCAALAGTIAERFGRRAIGLRCDISDEGKSSR